MELSIKLTEEQENLVVQLLKESKFKIPIGELTKKVFNNEKLDGRSNEAKSIKMFMVDRGFSVQTSKKKVKGPVELTEYHKEFIGNNVNKMKAHEMAQVLFENPNLNNLSSEARSIQAYVDELNPAIRFSNERSQTNFKPPKTRKKTIELINQHIQEAYNTDESKLDGSQEKIIDSVIGYLHNNRLLYELEREPDGDQQEIFLSTYIRHIHDKDDLTQQDLDVIILFCKEVIKSKIIESVIRGTQTKIEKCNDDKKLLDLGKIMTDFMTRHEKCTQEQQKLLKEIQDSRSDRLKKRQNANASLLNLIAKWKNKNDRDKLIELANQRRQRTSDKIDEFEALDQLKAEIWGVSKNEILNG